MLCTACKFLSFDLLSENKWKAVILYFYQLLMYEEETETRFNLIDFYVCYMHEYVTHLYLL